jgi:hypothetical protein
MAATLSKIFISTYNTSQRQQSKRPRIPAEFEDVTYLHCPYNSAWYGKHKIIQKRVNSLIT